LGGFQIKISPFFLVWYFSLGKKELRFKFFIFHLIENYKGLDIFILNIIIWVPTCLFL